jgi:hypothetical protein
MLLAEECLLYRVFLWLHVHVPLDPVGVNAVGVNAIAADTDDEIQSSTTVMNSCLFIVVLVVEFLFVCVSVVLYHS